MASKILIVTASLNSMGDRKDYGLLEVKEVETYVDAGWQIVDVVPVVPNQSGTGTIVTIHYLIRLSKA